MKIDLKARFKNKSFLVALFALALLLAQQVAAFFGADITVYSEQATSMFNTVLSALVLLGVVVDPSTPSASDKTKTEE